MYSQFMLHGQKNIKYNYCFIMQHSISSKIKMSHRSLSFLSIVLIHTSRTEYGDSMMLQSYLKEITVGVTASSGIKYIEIPFLHLCFTTWVRSQVSEWILWDQLTIHLPPPLQAHTKFVWKGAQEWIIYNGLGSRVIWHCARFYTSILM